MSSIPKVLWGISPYTHQAPRRNALPVYTENSFQFCRTNHLKTQRTAMGTKMAVAFANIFMPRIENQILSQSCIKPLLEMVYWRCVFTIKPKSRQNTELCGKGKGLKNIWLVIMTGDLLSVIFSPKGQVLLLLRTNSSQIKFESLRNIRNFENHQLERGYSAMLFWESTSLR